MPEYYDTPNQTNLQSTGLTCKIGTSAICKICKTKFTRRRVNQLYCGRNCSNKARSNIAILRCKGCSEDIRIPASWAKNVKFCSKECKRLHPKRETTDCAQCGTPVTYTPSRKRRFCSQACSNKGKFQKLKPNSKAERRHTATEQKYIGKRHYNITVLRRSDRKQGRKWLFECVCDCGKHFYAPPSVLFAHNLWRSCGCMKGRSKRKSGTAKGQVYKNYIRQASKRNLAFDLAEGYFYALTQQNCYYCDSPPQGLCKRRFEEFRYNGIDRVNSSIGYLPDNCVPCCGRCNRMKMDMSQELFIATVNAIAAKHPMGNRDDAC